METLSENILRPLSLYTDQKHINFFLSKLPISSIEHEENVIMTSCIPGEKVCIQRPKGVKDEMLHMYVVVLDELGMKILFTPFEMDVLKYLKMAPSRI